MPASSPSALKLFLLGYALCGLGVAEGAEQLPQSQPAGEGTGAGVFADYFSDSDVQLAEWLMQPPPGLSTAAPPGVPSRRAATGGRQSGNRLASVPNMFGDAPTTIIASTFVLGPTNTILTGTIPTPGYGGLSAKLAENDRPIPTDRVFFNFNHFHNAFELGGGFAPPPTPFSRQQSLDRYTFGFEKTFFDGWNSFEMRVPFYGAYDAELGTFGVDGGNIGNLSFVLKHLMYYDDNLAVGIGLGLDAPTGGDVRARLGVDTVRIANEAVHLLPYIGFNYADGDPGWSWNDGFFATGILQLIVSANGNTAQVVNPGGIVTSELGKLNDQTLLLIDVNAGYWLYRDSYAPCCTGLAVVGEIHYTTTLAGADSVSAQFTGGAATLGRAGNRFDVVNATIGLQALLYDTSSFRVAGVFPLRGENDDRMFDAEVQFQFNRFF